MISIIMCVTAGFGAFASYATLLGEVRSGASIGTMLSTRCALALGVDQEPPSNA